VPFLRGKDPHEVYKKTEKKVINCFPNSPNEKGWADRPTSNERLCSRFRDLEAGVSQLAEKIKAVGHTTVHHPKA
jgi:hypothetical protein